MGHTRSSAMSSFARSHTTSYLTLIETVRLSRIVFEILPVICRKSPILTHPPAFGAPQGLTPIEFRGVRWHQKTTGRFPGLSCGVVCVILCSAVLVEHRLVTDRQTQAHSIYRASIASRGKNAGNLRVQNVLTHNVERDTKYLGLILSTI